MAEPDMLELDMPELDMPELDIAELDDAWSKLDAELEAWAADGRTATFWWRDDDASAASPALEHLFALQRRSGIPLTLAVPPATAEPSLVEAVRAHPEITPVAHGVAHINHAPDGEKKAEFGAHRPIPQMCAELTQGLQRLLELFGTRAHSVLVPPWNRVAPGLPQMLPELGYCGISTYRRARKRLPAPGLVQTNCHLDIIDWRGARGLRQPHLIVNELTTHLHRQRTRIHASQPIEPTGILTHHLAHGPQAWEFLEQLFARIWTHGSSIRWLGCAEVFSPEAAVSGNLPLISGKA